MGRLWRWCKWTCCSFVAAGLFYLISALALGKIPSAGNAVAGPADYVFYACDNGVHVDIVLPAVGGGRDWFDYFPARDFAGDVTMASHVALGWGAREFFATTRSWVDIRPIPVLRALFWIDRSVMHVNYAGDPRGRENCRALRTDRAGSEAMFRFIDQSLELANGLPIPALGGYDLYDAFYAANGRYSLFRTCNVWSAELLRESGQKMALWSPFSFQVMGLLTSP